MHLARVCSQAHKADSYVSDILYSGIIYSVVRMGKIMYLVPTFVFY